jgi:hypothetical protein
VSKRFAHPFHWHVARAAASRSRCDAVAADTNAATNSWRLRGSTQATSLLDCMASPICVAAMASKTHATDLVAVTEMTYAGAGTCGHMVP